MEAYSIFVAGVHGAGKSTLCKDLAPRIDAHYVTASSLIRNVKRLDNGKVTSQIDDNQRVLVSEFSDLIGRHSSIILDGHFCLLNKLGLVEELPIKVFAKLLISKIVVVTATATQIYKRLDLRDGSTHQLEVEDIEVFQRAELERAYAVSNELHLPLFEVDTSRNENSLDEVIQFIDIRDR